MRPIQFELQDPLLAGRIERCRHLPSPPGVAAKIVELARDPTVSMTAICRVVELDPVLCAKVLRLANSPLYGIRREIDTISQAIAVLGVNETLTLALSFTLVKSLQAEGAAGLDYRHYWRRSLACATAARTLARGLKLPDPERFFLAGLLHDIGMLVVERVFPAVYRHLDARTSDHHQTVLLEHSELGIDHAQLGAALLQRWGFPEHLLYATYCSHEPDPADVPASSQALVHGVYLASLMAEIWWHKDWDVQVSLATAEAERLFRIQPPEFAMMLASGVAILHDAATVFEINIGDAAALEDLVEDAGELLKNRALNSMRQVVELRAQARNLAKNSPPIDLLPRRDRQSGLVGRLHCDRMLDDEYGRAIATKAPFSVAFVSFTAPAPQPHAVRTGIPEELLHSFAELAVKVFPRDTTVARYGAGEVVVLLPDTPAPVTRQRCQIMLEAIRRGTCGALDGAPAVSIGIATVEAPGQFGSARALLAAADAAVDCARDKGSMRVETYQAAA
ncbi:MAG: HDOD domain-containing protein [Gammaproteobacteria bacterium]|nr:HDOD domain-containing protein [Gammaproteobacteria bacterium]